MMLAARMMASVKRLLAVAQFYVNQAVKRGAARHKVQPGSVTFLQRRSTS
jgi:hypothetical protein